MRMSLRSLAAVLLTASTLLVSAAAAQASDPDKENITKATYSHAELMSNLGGRSMIISSQSKEKLTFKVNIDAEGDVTKLTYSHNITSKSPDAMNQYIRNAYNAIMATEFTAAVKDGEAVADTLTIEFDVVS